MISSLIGWFMVFVKRRWPGRVQYIKSEDCNYIIRDIPGEVRVNSSLVELNYSSLSPFPDPVTVYSTSGKKIFLWCTQRHAIDGNGGCLVLPEGMLLAKNFYKNRSDII